MKHWTRERSFRFLFLLRRILLWHSGELLSQNGMISCNKTYAKTFWRYCLAETNFSCTRPFWLISWEVNLAENVTWSSVSKPHGSFFLQFTNFDILMTSSWNPLNPILVVRLKYLPSSKLFPLNTGNVTTTKEAGDFGDRHTQSYPGYV